MTNIYNRRDFGFTIISRFEEVFRNYLISKLILKYSDFHTGIPTGIVSKINEKSPILFWDTIEEFFENSDFPDLLEISIYKDNFSDLFSDKIKKEDLILIMSSLYSLRCKIAHVKGFFTSIDLDKLIDLTKQLCVFIDQYGTLQNLISEIEQNPENVAIKVPIDFNMDFLESNGITNNLPTPDYEYEGGFVGREDDIKEIIKYLQREKFNVVTITGAGGVGKTSLALKVIQEITQKPKADKYDAIIWLSAKEDKLSPFGIQDIEPDFKSYEELLDTIINVLGFGIKNSEDITTVETKENTVATLFEIVDNILIIIDNLETVTDERILNFIIDAPVKAKFLITSRKGLGQVERRYELKQLKEKEAIYLFRQISKDKQITSLIRLDNDVIKKYVNKVSNYPLAIKWVIGQVARGRDINKVIDSIDDASGDISKFCFEQIFEMLNDDTKGILFALCCFEEPPTSSLLRYVVDIDNTTFDDCIEELILVSLVIPEQFKNEQNEIASKFYILPLTKGYIRQQLSNNSGLRENILKRLAEVEGTITATEQAKREYRFSLHNLGAISEEEKISAIFTQTAFQKYQAGLYDDAVENYKKAIEVAPRFSSVYRNWAVMESYENHLFEADQLMLKASELNPNDPQIWLLWGNIKRKANKLLEADEKYKIAFSLTPENPIILNAYGQTRGRLGDFETALNLLNSALTIDSNFNSKKHEIINRTSIAETLLAWSEPLLRDRNYKKSKENLFNALEECKLALKVDNNDEKSLGLYNKCNYKIGKFYVAENNLNDAKKFFYICVNNNSKGFGVARYKLKAGIELSKLLLKSSEYDEIKDVLEKAQLGNVNIVRRYPEMLDEVNSILEKVGAETTFLFGKIVYVNTVSDYLIIQSIDDPDKTYIAGKVDFVPILNSLSEDMQNLNVRFYPKIFVRSGKEKSEAKNIKIIN
jgi:LuxR family glucitol operon transcriptional activator